MQDLAIGNWARESHLSSEHLDSMRDLNRRFLDLADAWAGPLDRGGRAAALGRQVAPLTSVQRAAAASCPYALFDLRFTDDAYWRARLAEAGHLRVADEPCVDEATVDFVRLALFYTWHVASSTAFAAHLLLGMHGTTTAAFRRMTLDNLPALVATEAMNLTARWSDCAVYWTALLDAAARADPKALRRVQLSGLQLAAAAHLPVI
ncbi:MAG TPA: hypothetical protein VGI65_19455 [Steroidobacteraceae bacterium]